MIAVVITALQIPGDVELHPLEPDFTGPIDQANERFIALCPWGRHPLVLQGVTSDGWAGSGWDLYSQAVIDMKVHGHAKAVVARCELNARTCCVVWPGTGL
jgi:hypothetical protein